MKALPRTGLYQSAPLIELLVVTVWGLAFVGLAPADERAPAEPSVSVAENLLANGGFEHGLDGWAFRANRDADAEAELDRQVRHSGQASLRLRNASPGGEHVYGGLTHEPVEVEPNTTYRIRLWARGIKAGRVWFGGGPESWGHREQLPRNNFAWQPFTTEITTGPDQTEFVFRLNLDGKTDGLWIDDVQMLPADVAAEQQVFAGSHYEGLPPVARLLPALPAEALGQAPRVSFRHDEDPALGADVRLGWTDEALVIDLRVLDPTDGPINLGPTMWQNDSVQIGLDTAPDVVKPEGYERHSYDLIFALDRAGEVRRRAAFVAGERGGEFDWSGVRAHGEELSDGYRMRIELPWSSVRMDRRPEAIGFNVVINDGQTARQDRRFATWTPGIATGKDPMSFARVPMVGRDARSVSRFLVDRHTFDANEHIEGRYVTYALQDVPAGEVVFRAQGGSGETARWVRLRLGGLSGGMTRELPIRLRAGEVEAEGEYALQAVAGREVAASEMIERVNFASAARALAEQNRRRLAAINQRIEQHMPELANDPYVRLGITLAERYLKRVGHEEEYRQGPEWSKLQMTELGWVLDWTERILDRRLSRGGPAVVPMPTGGPVRIEEGWYVDPALGEGGRPVFFSGYGHFDQLFEDVGIFPEIAVNVLQHGAGASGLNRDGSLDQRAHTFVDWKMDELQRRGMKLDILVGAQRFPDWAERQAPEITPIVDGHFNNFNIDHPLARDVMERWLRAFVPMVKDHPALLSLCLTNEPTYGHSGRDKHSRPLWTEYLKRHHTSIEALNRLYGSGYASFEDVPVPEPRMPDGREARRQYYDWVRFNREHFADWHRWLNGIIKAEAPGVPTHVKIMGGFKAFKRERIGKGIDPELFTLITDLAGCDAHAYTDRRVGEDEEGKPLGEWAYQWQEEQIGYDLLHAFGNKPVVNSENHLIEDGTPADHVPAEFTYAIMWQGRMHHLAQSTTWVWDEQLGPARMGNIALRPASVYGVSKATLDINRYSEELATITRQPERVALLYSVPSVFWEPGYGEMVKRAYTALTFLGQPITFVSERQLIEGAVPDHVEWVVLPGSTHIQSEALEGLARFAAAGGRVVPIGEGCIARDQYDRPQALPGPLERTTPVGTNSDARALAEGLRGRLTGEGLRITPLLEGEAPAWGVEYRVVRDGDAWLVSMINFEHDPKQVSLGLDGNAVDLLLDGEAIDLDRISLEPMVPRLLRVTAD